MTAISSPVFFTVRPRPVLPDTGWTVRARSYSEFITLAAEITEYTSMSFTLELSGAGAGSITMDADSPFWSTTLGDGNPASTLQDRAYLFETYEDGILRAQWLGTTCEETLTEEGVHTVTISGPGIAHTLTWAKVLPPGYPSSLSTVSWPFKAKTPAMRIFNYLFDLAQRRGAIKFVTRTFTSTKDSAGKAWEDVTHPFTALSPFIPELGSDLLSQLEIATGADNDRHVGLRAEWMMWPGFKLDVRPVIGHHRERNVVFFEGALKGIQRTRARDDIANVIIIRDDYGRMSITSDAPSLRAWQRREMLQQRGTITDHGRRDAIARVVLHQNRREVSAWTLTVPYSTPGRRPFRDYGIGDWIGLSRITPAGVNVTQAQRVLAMTVRVDADAVEPELELSLQTLLDDQQRMLNRQLTKLMNTVSTTPVIHTPIPAPKKGVPVVWDPEVGWVPGDAVVGTGTGDGVRVFVQQNDPGSAAKPGDFWLELY